MAFLAHQPKTLNYIHYKFKMRLRLIAGWLYGEMLLHHKDISKNYVIDMELKDNILF
jgi:hypothetical protein